MLCTAHEKENKTKCDIWTKDKNNHCAMNRILDANCICIRNSYPIYTRSMDRNNIGLYSQ